MHVHYPNGARQSPLHPLLTHAHAHTLTNTKNNWGGGLLKKGSNSYGQLGRNPDLSDSSIVEALRGKKVVDVSCGDSFTVAVTDNNEVYAFGKELEGRIGTEGTGPSMEPKVVAIPNLPTADGAALAGKVGRITSRFNSTLVSMTYTEPDSPAAAPAEPV